MANYRPVSCLVTASKVMEKVICQQLTKFLEENDLLVLPKSQHGFRYNIQGTILAWDSPEGEPQVKMTQGMSVKVPWLGHLSVARHEIQN